MYAELQKTVRYLPPGCELIEGNRSDVVREVRQGQARGELVLLGNGLHPLDRDARTVFAVVRRLKPRPAPWRKPLLVAGGGLAVVGLLAWVAWILVSALVAVAVPLAVAALALLAATAVRSIRGGGSVEVLQRVTVRR